MLKRHYATVLFFLFLAACSIFADEQFYLIKMKGEQVGYNNYTVSESSDSLLMNTTVFFKLGQGTFEQRIKLTSETALEKKTLLPKRYQLEASINGFSQVKINTDFAENIAKQITLATGQEFNNEVKLLEPTYLADNNSRVDLYNYVLQKYDYSKKGVQNLRILIPLLTPQTSSALNFSMNWVGEENISVSNQEFATYRLAATVANNRIDFWVDVEKPHQIIKYLNPAEASEVTLADATIISNEMIAYDVSDQLRRAKLQIKTDADMGSFYDITYLQTHVDLSIGSSDKFVTENPNQRFDGKTEEQNDHVHLNGIFTIRNVEYTGENSPEFPITSSYDIPEDSLKSDDAEITQKAKEVTSESKNAWEATQKIVNWIFRNIRYQHPETSDLEKISAGVKECFTSKKGDSAAKSTLSVVMLNSLGIPARVAGGVLYVNGAFVQHNWTEVYMGKEWVPVDTTTGEAGKFSASHITLWYGLERIIPDLGDVNINVLDYQTSATMWQEFLPLQVGETTRYVFYADGKEIGYNTSKVVRNRTYNGMDCYEIQATLNLSDEASENVPTIQGQAIMYISTSGRPIFYQLEINDRKVEYAREGNTLHLKTAETEMDINITPKTFFIGDNMFWHWDLMFRQQELSTGQQFALSAFNPQNSTSYVVTVGISGVEEIEADGQTYECFKGEVDGQIFWISPIGRLIKYEAPKKKLVVEMTSEQKVEE